MVSTPSVSSTPVQQPVAQAATLIYDDWYPAMRSDRLRRGQTATAMLLGIPLLLGRTVDDKLFAMRDSCPHRGIPLSYGSFNASGVTCKYHGWRFDPITGQCKEIPSLTPEDTLDCTRVYATAFPCEERDGHAWVYVPGPGSGRVRPEDRDDFAASSGAARNLARAFAGRIWRRSCPAMSITESSG